MARLTSNSHAVALEIYDGSKYRLISSIGLKEDQKDRYEVIVADRINKKATQPEDRPIPIRSMPDGQYYYRLNAIAVHKKIEAYLLLFFSEEVKLKPKQQNSLLFIANTIGGLLDDIIEKPSPTGAVLPKRNLEAIYHKTNEVARVGGWEMDCTTNALFWTDITREIHEVENDFIPTLENAFDFFDTEESQHVIEEAVTLARKENKPYDLELKLITAKGNRIWVRTIGEPKFEDGKCIRIFGTIQDITMAKIAEENIINTKKLLEDVLNTSTDVAIISTDAKGIIRLFNKGAEKMLGYTAAEMIGIGTPEVFHCKEEIRKQVHQLKEKYDKEIDERLAFVYEARIAGSESKEWTYIHKDKRRISVKLTLTPMKDDHGEINGYLGVATDITEEKNAAKKLLIERARLKSFVKHVPASVAMLDNELKFVAYSDRWLEMYGLEGQDIIGKCYYDIFTNTSDRWKEIHKRGLSGKVICCDEDVWRPDGWSYDQYVRWEIRPWYYSKDDIGGILMLTEDVTEARLQRGDLEKSKLHAEQANRAKSEFLANMSHEIRTPLNGIIGFSDLVLKTELHERQEQYLTIVNQSANSLLNIINDILDFSKIEAGKLDLDLERNDLYELAEQASDIITYVIHQKGLEMLLNISPNIPRYAWIDSVRLKQILVNLLSNASKFTDTGEVELKITPLTKINHNGEMGIRFSVRDTGVGIKADKQDKIFEAFTQEDVSTTKKYGGTGLGLTISNRLLELMGSKLQLTSQSGKGSTFYFDLNVKCEDGLPTPQAYDLNLQRVLIVDDNANNRMIIERMLALKSIQTDQAKNGFEAIQKLVDGERYDVILLDFQMPYLNGIDTARKIRGNFEKQPIVFLHSSSEDKKISEASKELNIPLRLIKPIKMQEMYDTLLKVQQNSHGNTRPSKNKNDYESLLLNGKNTILIVEDNAINLLLGKTVIHNISPDTTVMEANNGKQALERMEERLPNLILMDVQMPEMNGYEATKVIRETYKNENILIFALTAGNLKGERERCLEAGMDDFIAKPFVEADLIRLLEKWNFSTASTEQNEHPITSSAPALFDIQKLQQVMGFKDMKDPIFRQLLTISKKELLKTKDKLEMLPGSENPDLSKIAHKLYSSANSLCMEQLASISAKLEREAISQASTQLLDELNSEAITEINNRLADLEMYLNHQ